MWPCCYADDTTFTSLRFDYFCSGEGGGSDPLHRNVSKCGCRCSLFFKKEMELSLIGLQNAGKTSLVNVIATGAFHEDMIPTVGFNMRKVTRGAVTIKLWDLGGQVPPHSPPKLKHFFETYQIDGVFGHLCCWDHFG